MVVAVLLIGMVSCAGLVLGRIYDGTLLEVLVAGAAAGAVLLSVLSRRLPAWTAGPLSAAGLFAYVLLSVRITASAADVPGGLAGVTADAARNGIPRLLTALIPVEPQPDTVLVPVVAAWLAGLAGAELAVRGGRVVLGYVPPALCFAGAVYAVGPNADPALWPGLAFAGLAVAGLVATGPTVGGGARPEPDGAPGTEPHEPSRSVDRPKHEQDDWAPAGTLRAIRLRAGAGAAAGLAVLAALSVLVGPVVAGAVTTVPEDPRRHVVPPHLDAFDENPLIRLSGWAVNPDQHLFDAVVDRDTRVRLAVLTDYDGVTWRVGATYRGAGRSLPRSAEEPSTVDNVRQRITIADLAGHLLPAVALPRRVDGIRVAYDAGSGTLAKPEGLTPGTEYTVDSDRPRMDVNLLPGAEVASGPTVARQLHLGRAAPDELERLAKQLAEGNAAPYPRAAAIEAFLAEHYRFAADAPSGHAYPNLGFFLFGTRDAGGQRGTSEQFAAAFAVLARLTGLPARVVVGFRVRAGTPRVTGADALAWPEVLFTGVGWVPFNPVPEPDAPARPVEEDFRPRPEPSVPPPSAVPTVALSVPPPSAVAALPPADQESRGRTAMVLATVATAMVVLGAGGFAIGVPLLRRAQRRRRLDRGPPADRVAGAWLEIRDALRLAGRPAERYLAATEVADHAAAAAHSHRSVRAPAPPLTDLVTTVNATVFGHVPPDEADAAQARQEALAYIAELRARQPWWRRLLWTLHPGPLLRTVGPAAPCRPSRREAGLTTVGTSD